MTVLRFRHDDVLRLILAVALVLLIATTAIPEPSFDPPAAIAVSPLCALDWEHIKAALGEYRLLQRGAAVADDGRKYGGIVLVSPEERRMAVVVAEWGAEDDPSLGPVIYCAIFNEAQEAIEEIGHNPLKPAKGTSL